MAAFNPLALLAERTCAPIYNAIDTGNNALAIRHADKVLTSQPNIVLASALKSIALIRIGKRNDANQICDTLLKRGIKPGEEGVVQPLTWSLERLGRDQDQVGILEAVSKANPSNKDLSVQAFSAMIKNQLYQKAQQVSFKLHKSFDGKDKTARDHDPFFWWSIQSYLLLSRASKAPGATLALPLSERMIQKQIESHPFTAKSEESLWLYLQVLLKQGKKVEAFDLLAQPDCIGSHLCDRNLGLEFLRRELANQLDRWSFIQQETHAKILAGSRNWAHISAYIQASAKLDSDAVKEAETLFDSLLSLSANVSDRSLRLAQLELVKATFPSSPQPDTLLGLAFNYFTAFATKACCHEDLLPYLGLLPSTHQTQLRDQLESLREKLPFKDETSLHRNINISKIQRTLIPKQSLTEEAEVGFAIEQLRDYVAGLQVGKHLADTEMQPADDMALLGAQALVSAYVLSGYKLEYLFQTVSLLEYACLKSPKGYALRMLLIRCYLMLGCFDRANAHYTLLGVKGIQHDTLSHFFSDRISSFAVRGCVNSQLSEMVSKTLAPTQEIYTENARATPEMIIKAFEHGTYSRIEEFVDFQEAVERSVQRQMLKLELARTKLVSIHRTTNDEQKSLIAEAYTKLTREVASDTQRGLHDQRDFDILPNYQPLEGLTIYQLLALGPRPGTGWVRCMSSLFDHGQPLESGSEADVTQLTPQERAMYHLVLNGKRQQDKDQYQQQVLLFFEARKAELKATVDHLAKQTGKPFEAIHTVAISIETLRHLDLVPLDNETKQTVHAHLLEMSTLVNHLSRTWISSTVTSPVEGWKVLTQGLNGEANCIAQNTMETISNSLRKTLDSLRDSLRDV